MRYRLPATGHEPAQPAWTGEQQPFRGIRTCKASRAYRPRPRGILLPFASLSFSVFSVTSVAIPEKVVSGSELHSYPLPPVLHPLSLPFIRPSSFVLRQFLATLFLLCSSLFAGELVPFAPPWNDALPGPTDLSGTLPKPAGRLGYVHVKDGHLFSGTQRLRLFGANFTAGGCFPDHATAEQVAARMAKFGLNAVRFHFLEAVWGNPTLINYPSGNWQNWNTDSLDRLDYFIAQLKARGIYTNLNLLVGRYFGLNDGVNPQIKDVAWKTAHAIGFFHAPHLEAQKQYARKLLTHRNPYTKLTYAEDPAVALVEINNENGLLHTWMEGDLDDLPEFFMKDLQAQWNAWLVKRYTSTAALAKAWNTRNDPLDAELLANAGLSQDLKSWMIEQHQGASVDASVEKGAVVLRVRKAGTASWHVQFNQPKLAVKKGVLYTLTFRAAADQPRSIALDVMQAHDPWGDLGFSTRLALNKDLRAFSFTFMLNADDTNARLNFGNMNQEGAEFRFADLSLKPGGRIGLSEGETVEKSSVYAPKKAGTRTLTAEARQDWIRFLWETERAYWTAMRTCLKEELGVNALVTGTIVGTSTPHLMSTFDVTDSHAYWEHPQFPGASWDRTNWIVKNISMVDDPDHATLPRLAFQRVAGKPHLVSEYNHPAPNTHTGEAPLFIAAGAALQDWDAIFLYSYAHDDAKIKAGCIPDFFDFGQHPTLMANVPIASLLFRRADIAPARHAITIPLPAEKEIALIAQLGSAWNVLPTQQLGVDLKNALCRRIELDLSGKAPPVTVATPAELKSDTDEITWRLPTKNAGIFKACSPKTKLLIGHLDEQTVNLGHGVEISIGKTLGGWCTFALTLLDGEAFDHNPRRALLVVTGYTENTAMGWKDGQKNTVGENWGRAPSLVEPLAAIVRVPYDGVLPVIYPLDNCGQRGKPITATEEGASAEFQVGPPSETLWYEIEFGNNPKETSIPR